MDRKKQINFFFLIIVVILGSILYKHIDFKNFTLKNPILDVLYLIVFFGALFFLIKDYFQRKK